MFRCFEGTILETWFDELVFGIGVTSLWAYFYSIHGTGQSTTDQFCVTYGSCVLEVEQIVNTLVIFPCDRCHDVTLAHCGVTAIGVSQRHIDGRRVAR